VPATATPGLVQQPALDREVAPVGELGGEAAVLEPLRDDHRDEVIPVPGGF
jgi:hypothetical protein